MLNAVRDVFLGAHYATILTKEGSGFVYMLDVVLGDQTARSAGASAGSSSGDGDIVMASSDRVCMGLFWCWYRPFHMTLLHKTAHAPG